MKKLLLIIVCLILNLAVFAAGNTFRDLSAQEQEVFKAMQNEMQRNLKNLKMDKFARPYYIAYKIIPETRYLFNASQGVLMQDKKTYTPEYEVQVRIGSPKEDNSYFNPSVWLPKETDSSFALNYEDVSKFLWQTTDIVYKNSLAELTEKQAYKKNKHINQKYDDFSFYPAQEHFDNLTEPTIDKEYWREVAQKTSAKGALPEFEDFMTFVNINFAPSYFLTSRGSKYLQDKYSIKIRFIAQGRLEDGLEFNLNKTLTYADFKDVPSLEQLEKEAEDFAKEVITLQKAKKVDAYIGPILLEGSQAADLMRVLSQGISRTKHIASNEDYSYYDGAFSDKLGLKVFSAGFDVIDDPLRKTFDNKKLAGYYEIDEEGVKAEKIQIIENGILKDLPFTASLTKNNKKSNGHARSYYGYTTLLARPSNLILLARSTIAEEDFIKTFQNFCAEQGLKACPVIKARDGDTFFGFMIDSKTGAKTPVYGEMTTLNTRSLRDIKYASDKMQVYNEMTRNGFGYSIITPDLILDNGEINQSKRQPARKPLVKRP
jgi:Predicted Zn-dependent proteases and their inactivated homologs